MTFSKHFVRGLALSALTVGLAGSVSAQNGTNFHVMSNGADVIYGSIGAGGSSIGGADGIGHWIDGNSLRGNQVTLLGDHGYRQQGWFTSQCVLGPPIVGLAIKFPLITVIEFDGTNANDQDVFTRLGCAPGSGGALAGVTTAGFLPYGAPAGTSASFLLSGLPSGLGLPSSTTILIPNNGLVPSSNGGTATVIAAAQVAEGLPIASTGFCWIVSFGWLPSALVSADHIDGWWEWLTSSADNNQYWNMSNDELNVFSSNTVATAAGVTGAFNFFGTLEYEFYSKTVDPSINEVLAPVGFQGTGPYYTSPTIGGVNAGGDMGQHGGISLGSGGGASNPVTGLPAQDLGLSGALSSFGWASWNNDTRLTPIVGSFRTVWAQVDFDQFAGLPSDAGTENIVDPGSGMRLGSDIPAVPSVWPQPFTLPFLTPLTHSGVTTVGGETDPVGFPAGSFGIPAVWDATGQFPVGPLSGTNCLGSPLALQGSSIGFFPGSFFDFLPNSNPVSMTSEIMILD